MKSCITLVFFFCWTFFVSCEEKSQDKKISVQEMISEYLFKDENGLYLDTENFNCENYDLGKVIEIDNYNENIEFILMFRYSSKMIYYKHGVEVEYSPNTKDWNF